MRFPNEFKYFRDMGLTQPGVRFIPLYIQRDIAEIHVTEDSHPSEKSVFLFRDNCLKVDNNGTIEGTETRIKSLLHDYIYEGDGNVATGTN
jgi:hypothetical protein